MARQRSSARQQQQAASARVGNIARDVVSGLAGIGLSRGGLFQSGVKHLRAALLAAGLPTYARSDVLSKRVSTAIAQLAAGRRLEAELKAGVEPTLAAQGKAANLIVYATVRLTGGRTRRVPIVLQTETVPETAAALRKLVAEALAPGGEAANYSSDLDVGPRGGGIFDITIGTVEEED